jgi:glucose 1-dehydrogenase
MIEKHATASMPKRSLESQVAIVTGGATGIGAAVVRELAARGACVAINHLPNQDATALIAKIEQAGGKAISAPCDVADPAAVASMVATTVARFGRLDIMVANAGLQDDAPSLDMSLEHWNRTIKVDLSGQFLCAQAAARQFIKQKSDAALSRAAGKIVCMLSVHCRIPWMGHVNYAAAKAGAEMLMKTLAQEWGAKRIRVVGVAPGAIKTAINQSVWGDPASYEALMKLIPYQRIGEAEDVAKTVAWLVSDEADYITGSTIYVDGGMMLYPGFMGNG